MHQLHQEVVQECALLLPLGAQEPELDRIGEVRDVAHCRQDAQERHHVLEAEFPFVPILVFSAKFRRLGDVLEVHQLGAPDVPVRRMASEFVRYGALLRRGLADRVVDGVDAPEVVIQYGNGDAVPVIARSVVTHDDT
eukprot:1251362-Heterocapsa_arctica.AAC.1